MIWRNHLLKAPVTSFPALQHWKRAVPSAPPPDKSSRRKLKRSLVESQRGSPMSVTDRLLVPRAISERKEGVQGQACGRTGQSPHRNCICFQSGKHVLELCSGTYMTVKDRQLPMRIPLSGDDTRLLSLHRLPLCSIIQILE